MRTFKGTVSLTAPRIRKSLNVCLLPCLFFKHKKIHGIAEITVVGTGITRSLQGPVIKSGTSLRQLFWTKQEARRKLGSTNQNLGFFIYIYINSFCIFIMKEEILLCGLWTTAQTVPWIANLRELDFYTFDYLWTATNFGRKKIISF